jgi:hypothetical protein
MVIQYKVQLGSDGALAQTLKREIEVYLFRPANIIRQRQIVDLSSCQGGKLTCCRPVCQPQIVADLIFSISEA